MEPETGKMFKVLLTDDEYTYLSNVILYVRSDMYGGAGSESKCSAMATIMETAKVLSEAEKRGIVKPLILKLISARGVDKV